MDDASSGLEGCYQSVYDYVSRPISFLTFTQIFYSLLKFTENEHEILLKLRRTISRGGQCWNEVELENKFISPLFVLADIDDEQIGYFLERPLSATIGDYQLSGTVDDMIATGFALFSVCTNINAVLKIKECRTRKC